MDSWIALGSALVAVVALAVAVITYRVQSQAQVISYEQQLWSLFDRIHQGLVDGGALKPLWERTPAERNSPKVEATYRLALQAESLSQGTEIELDWLQRMNLAVAFSATWDPQRAAGYWESLDKDADAGVITGEPLVRLKSTLAFFYCNRGLPEDKDRYRAAMTDAKDVALAEARRLGEDFGRSKQVQLTVQAAQLELLAGDEQAVVERLVEAWLVAEAIASGPRRRDVFDFVGGFIAAHPEREHLASLVTQSLGRRAQGATQAFGDCLRRAASQRAADAPLPNGQPLQPRS